MNWSVPTPSSSMDSSNSGLPLGGLRRGTSDGRSRLPSIGGQRPYLHTTAVTRAFKPSSGRYQVLNIRRLTVFVYWFTRTSGRRRRGRMWRRGWAVPWLILLVRVVAHAWTTAIASAHNKADPKRAVVFCSSQASHHDCIMMQHACCVRCRHRRRARTY